MNRLSFLAFWVGVIVVASFMLYRVKYEVQSIKAQIKELNYEMAQEKETLHVVAAEWAYLNRPERIEALADKYLTGKSVTVDQVAEIEAISFQQRAVASVSYDDGFIDDDVRSIVASYSSNDLRQ